MSVQVYGCNHLAIEVGNREEAVAFYRDLFGLRLLEHGEGDAFFALGEHQFLALFVVPEVQPDRLRHFGILVRDEEQLAEVRTKITQKYRLPLIPGFRCDFRDPWGNRIQVVDLHDESLVWLLPYREVQAAGIVFRTKGEAKDAKGDALPAPLGLRPEIARFALTADAVVLGAREGELFVLLIERRTPPYAGSWALPGGFVEAGEEPSAAAARELAEETGVSGLALWEVGVFGKPGRDPRGPVVSVAHAAWADPGTVRAAAGSDAAAVRWFPLSGLPSLAFDHKEMIRAACLFFEEKLSFSQSSGAGAPDGELLRRALAQLEG
ncbi:Bifunctional NMN adenylyltransferase/Nudix hydrolase [Methylacidimicrobium cyclopophantes]|uniref:Bifunctional NMN adenylyltransferase/Nudix hydrolase n=1 Tax=Methylacidimicrobium cyclopophantes TaxID=1041766 RepID=A0A5E6MCP5_9BACT|nr:NUDIX domain-containing protein [Methylacidimicrobium cyclopophantes]VVM05551.1 Bifunctional NMN adenylyltransferase/Nudix hydrolase [Methylacidimicrobium cyclopophantes]